MANLWSKRWGKLLIVISVGLLVALLVYLYRSYVYRHVFWAVIAGLVTMTAIWFGIDFAVREARRRREASFDAGLAAKEGIEDRRREWANWTAELKKQGIDRYELPFYLLVGEPQSGKSILLQNSDLHFPFGQTRLSGIGGTRGCDWWFTEEAVVLDLAGRLFTHEGGVSDEAEWQAFLDLLCEYRPMCPANGILLVIPCDRLIQESAEKASAKANKIQGALLTLTNKLQARLPVYVVLTKADKVFGFAECVHRLEAQERQQMFGWSRTAERFEAPFDLEETRTGFESIVERARLLRAKMLSSARIPDALPEIDRLYAFPDELAALYPTLMVYLQRIFSESTLVDRLYFRGLYLTSGLQTGAPIAKVCADLFKGSREADTRNLEALFSKQRAYFIKDLVRKRVFAERGLVRPTRGRVMRARRNAWIGYGAAAAIAVIGIVGSILYLADKSEDAKNDTYLAALQEGYYAGNQERSIVDVLGLLERIRRAIVWDRPSWEIAFGSTADNFEDLYAAVFDRMLAPLVIAACESELAGNAEPASYAEFEERRAHLEIFLGDIDLRKVEHRQLWVKLTGNPSSGEIPFPASSNDPARALELADASLLRTELDPPAVYTAESRAASRSRTTLIENMNALWDGTLTQGKKWQVINDLGYLLACKGLQDDFKKLEDMRPGDRNVHSLCTSFATSIDNMRKSQEVLPSQGGKPFLADLTIEAELLALEEKRNAFLEKASPGRKPGQWPKKEAVSELAKTMLADAVEMPASKDFYQGIVDGAKKLATKLTGRPPKLYQVPLKVLQGILDEDLEAITSSKFLPLEGGEPDGLLADLEKGAQFDKKKRSSLAYRVFEAKCQAVGPAYKKRFDDVKVLEAALSTRSARADGGVDSVARHLAAMRRALHSVQGDAVRNWSDHVEVLLRQCEQEMSNRWEEVAADDSELTASIVRELSRYLSDLDLGQDDANVETPDPAHTEWLGQVDRLLAGRLMHHEQKFLDYWGSIDNIARANLKVMVPEVKKMIQPSILNEKIRKKPPVPQDLAPANAVFATLDLARKASEQLKKLSYVPPALQVSNDPIRDGLQRFVEQFETDISIYTRGPEMAKILWGSRSNAALHPTENAVYAYLTKLRETIEAELLREVRDLYVEDLKQLALDFVNLFDVLYGTKTASASDREVVSYAQRLFDRGGRLDELLDSYKLASEAAPLDLWPQGATVGNVDQQARDFHRFLVNLKVFLRGQEAKPISQSTIRLVIEPAADQPDTVWSLRKETRMTAFFYPSSRTCGVESVALSAPTAPRTLDWDFRAQDEKGLCLRWSRSTAKKDPPDPGDAEVTVRGSFAPLILAWQGQKEGTRFLIDPTFLAPNASLRAPFYITFEPGDMPVRPERPLWRP